MKTAANYIDEIKARNGLPSDYAAARALGVTKAGISSYRTGRSHFAPDVAERVAGMLDIPVEDVLLDAALSQAKTDVERKAWQRVVDRLSNYANGNADNRSTGGLFIMSTCKRLLCKANLELVRFLSLVSRMAFPVRLYA